MRLREFRIDMGMTVNELSERTGVSARYIRFLESGERTPSLKVATTIAHEFKKPIEEIFLPKKCTESTEK
ncbi:MAG: helix-turn-helix transcriptional regulator [Tissierellia bacterium]|nr:helix-turn-helix transcriptional regulator [Tissierellia bacterium]